MAEPPFFRVSVLLCLVLLAFALNSVAAFRFVYTYQDEGLGSQADYTIFNATLRLDENYNRTTFITSFAAYFSVSASRLVVDAEDIAGERNVSVEFHYTDAEKPSRSVLEYLTMNMSPALLYGLLNVTKLQWKEPAAPPLPDPSSWQFRLVGGKTNDTGRLEVRPSATDDWGTVCDDDFNVAAAIATCHSLGYNVTQARVSDFVFGPGSGTIYMDKVHCNASTRFLQNCSFVYSTANVTKNNCQHSEDIGVDCRLPPTTNPQEWSLRLTGGDQPNRGRLEVKPSPSSDWGTVCRGVSENGAFDEDEAVAACRSLGFNVSFANAIPFFGGGQGAIYLDKVYCAAGQKYLQNCSFVFSSADNSWTSCTHDSDVGLDCGSAVPVNRLPIVVFVAKLNASENKPSDLIVRLADWMSVLEERIWMIGYTTNATANGTWHYVTFRFMDPPVEEWRTSPSRTALDNYLYNVDKYGLKTIFGIYELTSNSTRSQRPAAWEFRLSGGTTSYSGRLEVRPNASADWGTVCSDGFDSVAATAACHSLGLTTTSAVPLLHFGLGFGVIYMDDIECSTSDFFLQNCSYTYSTPTETYTNCQHWEDVGVNCYPSGEDSDCPIYTGSIENGSVFNKTQFLEQLARFLGAKVSRIVVDVAPSNSTAPTAIVFHFTEAADPELPRSLLDSTAKKMTNTTMLSLGITALSWKDPILPPLPDPSSWQFRLVGGKTNDTGRLEVRPSASATWGTVCKDHFDVAAAIAACHSLGFDVSFAAVQYSAFGPGTGTIYMDDVTCNASTRYLPNCTFVYSTANISLHKCRHTDDIGVDCPGSSCHQPPAVEPPPDGW